ncbi:MAG TPA: glycosyltransferase [Lacipirellulaceae bacterium]|nr:glycosyltransferase [Lacipirellulaceae bacterium]
MNVVVVDWDVAYPADSGKRLRTLNLMLELAGRHNITYFTRGSGDSQQGRLAAEFLNDRGIRAVFADAPIPAKKGWQFYARVAASMASKTPYAVAAHESAKFRGQLAAFAAENPVDLWQLEWSAYVGMLAHLPQARTLLMAHNVDSLIWQRYAETESRRWAGWYLAGQWRRFVEYERQAFRQASHVVAVSQDDAQLMRADFQADHVDVVENGVDLSMFTTQTAARDPRELLFVGSLDWRPNLDGVEWFLEAVLPLVRAAEPDARLTVVGRRPPAPLAARLRQTPNCSCHADVPDVRPYLAQAGIMVVPLRIGGGSRLKILEAAAAGLPVASTTVGAEGLRFQAGRDLTIADDPRHLAAAIVQWI